MPRFVQGAIRLAAIPTSRGPSDSVERGTGGSMNASQCCGVSFGDGLTGANSVGKYPRFHFYRLSGHLELHARVVRHHFAVLLTPQTGFARSSSCPPILLSR